jgi:hypothetical protein
MADPAQLEKRIAELEREVRALRGRRATGIRHRSAAAIGDLPLLSIAIGPDLAQGQMRGHARGVIAIGDIATGVVALGGLARGVVAFGGLAAGLVSVGGLSVGLLLALGGFAIGSVAVGGMAVGGAAVGGGAAGYFACGGGAAGTYVVSAARRDAPAEDFFRRSGLAAVCRPR